MKHGRMLNINFIYQNRNRLLRNIFDTSIYWCYCIVLRSLKCRSKSHLSNNTVLEWYFLRKINRILYLLCYHIFIHHSIDRHKTCSKSFLHFGFHLDFYWRKFRHKSWTIFDFHCSRNIHQWFHKYYNYHHIECYTMFHLLYNCKNWLPIHRIWKYNYHKKLHK